MAQTLLRKTLKVFGLSGPTSSFGQFGSKAAGSPQTSQDPAVIQQRTAWVDGWQNAVVTGNKVAYIEDMNGWCFVHSYELGYVFQMGIPEWDIATVYCKGSVVQGQYGTARAGQWFVSLADANTGNVPPTSASNAFWKWVNPPTPVDGGMTNNVLPKASGTGPATLVNSNVSDDGTNVIIAKPLKFPDATVQSSAAVGVTVQNDVTSSRNFGSTYHNTTSKPIFVSVVFSSASSNTGGADAYSDASLNPTTLVSRSYCNNVSVFLGSLFFIVLPGNYYKVVPNNTGSKTSWIEWS